MFFKCVSLVITQKSDRLNLSPVRQRIPQRLPPQKQKGSKEKCSSLPTSLLASVLAHIRIIFFNIFIFLDLTKNSSYPAAVPYRRLPSFLPVSPGPSKEKCGPYLPLSSMTQFLSYLSSLPSLSSSRFGLYANWPDRTRLSMLRSTSSPKRCHLPSFAIAFHRMK